MDEKTKNTLIKVGLKVVSVILLLVFTFSCLGATAIIGVRHYFKDGEFETMVNELNLEEVKFTSNGETYSASDYIYKAVTELMPAMFKGQNLVINSLFGKYVDTAVKDIISSDVVDKAIKDTIMGCVDYYLESDYKEAKSRLKDGKYYINNTEKYADIKTAEDAVKIYVRDFIITTVENTSGISSDQIIVLLSNNTKTKLIIGALVSAILLIICNLSTVFDLLMYFGISSFAFGVVVKTLYNKFETAQTDKSLIGYQMLKPLVDSFKGNMTAGFVIGVILILAFIALFILYRQKAEPLKTEK